MKDESNLSSPERLCLALEPDAMVALFSLAKEAHISPPELAALFITLQLKRLGELPAAPTFKE